MLFYSTVQHDASFCVFLFKALPLIILFGANLSEPHTRELVQRFAFYLFRTFWYLFKLLHLVIYFMCLK